MKIVREIFQNLAIKSMRLGIKERQNDSSFNPSYTEAEKMTDELVNEYLKELNVLLSNYLEKEKSFCDY